MTTAPTATKEQAPLPAPRTNGHAPAEGKPPPALPVDLVTLPDDVLAVLAVEVPGEQQRRKAKKEAEFFELVRERAAALCVTPARLAAAIAGKSGARARPSSGSDGRSVVKPKYWNPKDHSQRWSGRGGQPAWLTEHLAAGGTLEECLIPEGAV